MNLIQRLKNIWKMSEYKPLENGEKLETGDIITPVIKPIKTAQIIKRTETLPEVLEKINEIEQ